MCQPLTAWHPVPPRLQNIDKLEAITEYTFDITDHEFRMFCDNERTLFRAMEHSPEHHQYFADLALTESDWIAEQCLPLRFAQEWNGKRHRYSDDEMRSRWACMQISRAVLQDAWNRFLQNERRWYYSFNEAHHLTTTDRRSDRGTIPPCGDRRFGRLKPANQIAAAERALREGE